MSHIPQSPPRRRRTKQKPASWTPAHLAGLGFGLLAALILIDQSISLMSPSDDSSRSRPVGTATVLPASEPPAMTTSLPTALPDNFDLSPYSGDPTVGSAVRTVNTDDSLAPTADSQFVLDAASKSQDSPPVAYDKIIGLRPYLPPPPGINLTATDATGIELSSGFECSLRNVDIKTIAPRHFEVKFQSGRDHTGFFAFQLQHAQGQQVLIDFVGVPAKWHTLNPVYCNDYDAFLRNDTPRRAGSVNSLSSEFSAEANPIPVSNPAASPKPAKARNGPFLPDTTGTTSPMSPSSTKSFASRTRMAATTSCSPCVPSSAAPPI